MEKKQYYYILDFDSTFITTEGLDELAGVVLKRDKNGKEKIKKLKRITSLGMEGKLSFDQSLEKRLELLHIHRRDIDMVAGLLKKKITQSIRKNKSFFKVHKERIYVISGGFREFIIPVLHDFGISNNHIFANSFIFDTAGEVKGFDRRNPLSKKDGKIKMVKSLHLKGKVVVIGDGYTDYQVKQAGTADIFVAFTENINRPSITKKADFVAPSFDYIINLFY